MARVLTWEQEDGGSHRAGTHVDVLPVGQTRSLSEPRDTWEWLWQLPLAQVLRSPVLHQQTEGPMVQPSGWEGEDRWRVSRLDLLLPACPQECLGEQLDFTGSNSGKAADRQKGEGQQIKCRLEEKGKGLRKAGACPCECKRAVFWSGGCDWGREQPWLPVPQSIRCGGWCSTPPCQATFQVTPFLGKRGYCSVC